MNRIMSFLIRIYRYGQMSGMVEPISGVLGALIVVVSCFWYTVDFCKFVFSKNYPLYKFRFKLELCFLFYFPVMETVGRKFLPTTPTVQSILQCFFTGTISFRKRF